MKGGAAGGGYAQVVPMEEINLHFTGDLHAITAANNLLAALLDNHIQQGNALDIDVRRIAWRRCMDTNDRQLRSIVSGLGGKANGVPHEDGFDITAASEVMAVFCLAADLMDLKERLGRIVVAYNRRGEPVTARQLDANGAMTVLLKQAIWPNLVQTIGNTPAFVHGGPFANIAHGCNSIVATRCALRAGDYCVTEAGFGADLGAEKFLDIKCRKAGLKPSAVVVVATVRALKSHGGVAKADLSSENVEAMEKGMGNLFKHCENMREVYSLPVVVAVNRFASDTGREISRLVEACEARGIQAVPCNVWREGGAGAIELAKAVCAVVDENENPGMTFAYPLEESYEQKIRHICERIYGAKRIQFGAGVLSQLAQLERDGYDGLPVCMAKTQYSLSDDPRKIGRPEDFEMTIRSVRLSAGAGFVVAFTGEIIAMPGLPKTPAANAIDIDKDGNIVGLF